MKESITAVILTFNEEKHIKRCITSISDLVERIIVIDSFSQDNTVKIASKLGAEVIQNQWPGFHADQFNWCLKNVKIESKWLLRLDADEIIPNDLKNELSEKLNSKNVADGFVLNRGHIFYGTKIKWGGTYPSKLLRIWRNGIGKCEDKLMDEHIVLKPDVVIDHLENPFWDNNLNTITWWIEKHNEYSTKEAIQFLLTDIGVISTSKKNKKLYYKTPIFIRAFLYFIYRYFFRLGFLDGKNGFLWHFLQGFWYRILVDIKISEVHSIILKEKISTYDAIKKYAYKNGLQIERFLNEQQS